MKKLILALLAFACLLCAVSCDEFFEEDETDLPSQDTQANDTEDTSAPIETDEACAHVMGEWTVSKLPTAQEDGEEQRGCTLCPYAETRPLLAIGTEGLLFTLSEDGTSYSVSAGSATEGNVLIPAYHNGLPVTSIGYLGFAEREGELEEVARGSYAFLQCSDLKTVILPSTLTVIGDMAFAGCESLERVVIPSSVTVIGDGAFELCKSLEQIELPSSVTAIGEMTFALCESLRSVVIPKSVREIGAYAFALTAEELSIGYYHSDVKITIPDTEVILLLREWSSFFSWGVEIYYLDENGSEVLIQELSFEDSSVDPFSKGDFEIVNNGDNTFTVRAGDAQDIGRWIDQAFAIPQCVSLYLPKAGDNLTLFYGGERDEWDAVAIAEGNQRLEQDNLTVKDGTVYYYSESEPIDSTLCWHYVDGVPTPYGTES